MRKPFLYFIISLTLSAVNSQAQSVADKLVKVYTPTSWWLTLRYDQYLQSGSFFFIENNTRFNLEPTFGNSPPFNAMYRTYIMAGYEHKASDKWYLGFSEKYVLEAGKPENSGFLYTRVNISHRGDFLKMRFIKELTFDHLYDLKKSDNPYLIIENYGRVSFAPSLVKEINLGGKPLYFLLNYRAYILFDFKDDGFSVYDKRRIDKTRLKFEIDYKITDKFLISLFAIRDTNYSYRLGTTGSVVVEESRLNRITPTFGLGLNYIINAPEDFLPGFPGK